MKNLRVQLRADRLEVSNDTMDKVRHVSEQTEHHLSSRTLFITIESLS